MSSSTLAAPSGRASSTARAWLLSGVSRSGTSLCCRLAGELRDLVALFRPIRYGEYGPLDSPPNAAARIQNVAREARERLRASAAPPPARSGDVSTTAALRKAIRRPGSVGSGAGGPRTRFYRRSELEAVAEQLRRPTSA